MQSLFDVVVCEPVTLDTESDRSMFVSWVRGLSVHEVVSRRLADFEKEVSQKVRSRLEHSRYYTRRSVSATLPVYRHRYMCTACCVVHALALVSIYHASILRQMSMFFCLYCIDKD